MEVMAGTKTKSGQLIDAAARFLQRRDGRHVEECGEAPLLTPVPSMSTAVPHDNVVEHAPASRRQTLGERLDGTIDLAAWRARWVPIFQADFHTGRDGLDPVSDEDGSLNVFHDKRSNALEFFAMDADGVSVRHILTPSVAMRLLIAINSAYGFDPKGPDGRSLADVEDDGPGPMTA